KFLFFDVIGLEKAVAEGYGDEFEILIYLGDMPDSHDDKSRRPLIDADTFQLGCTPIINLFKKTAEPIRLTHQQTEYHVIPDIHRQMDNEIYAIQEVSTKRKVVDSPSIIFRRYQPFYSLRHADGAIYGSPSSSKQGQAFWYATRRPRRIKDME